MRIYRFYLIGLVSKAVTLAQVTENFGRGYYRTIPAIPVVRA